MIRAATAALACAALSWCAGLEAQSEPIRMVLACQSTQNLTVRFENVGTEDTAIVVGMSLANGHRYILNGLVLHLTRNDGSGAESWRFYPADPPMVISGRVDDWIVPLPVGAAFLMKLDASQFWSEQFQRLDGLPPASRVSLRLPLRAPNPGIDLPALKFLRIWTGSGLLTSNEISIPGQCR